ncbi:hypothetical protein [Marinobacter sp. AC-23]|uniref:hypothetical protein n=1 Tax=Marinobacter sp. AC-23 TaxID=1879031 RepID=UPI0020C88072|nr:hypothetical protein [Marinobacter sp. AC-23]
MYVLILEDDELIGDLLETVVAGAYPGALSGFIPWCNRQSAAGRNIRRIWLLSTGIYLMAQGLN